MVATPSTSLDARSREILLRTAASSIEARFASGLVPEPPLAAVPVELLVERASFVTLTTGGELRGCCGTIEPRRALVLDVWRNAQASAFEDPRFAPLERAEWSRVEIEISVLSPLEQIAAGSEQELLEQLVPGEHGLLIAWRGMRATFLPKVWEQLPDPREFLRRLKLKAGWPADFWAEDVAAWRYGSEQIPRPRP